MDAQPGTNDGQSTVGLLASGILTTASLVANGFQITAAQLANGFQATAAQFAQLAEQLRGGSGAGPTAVPRAGAATLTLVGAGPYEQLIVRDSVGTGTVRAGIDGRIYFIMQTRIVDLVGRQEGSYE